MTADDGAVSDENAASHQQTARGRDATSENAVNPVANTGENDRPVPNLVLVGPPGAGKSTIGRKLARELGVELYDTDAGIEERTGRTIPEIFAADGEPEFRRIEEEVVRDAVLAGHGVVSLGGGSVLSAATRALLRGRTVVYLEISVGEGLRRTGASTNRPLLNDADPAKKYRELMKIRRPLYREVATVRVRTDGRSPGRVVRMVLAKLGLEPVARPADSATETPTVEPGISSSRSRARRKRRRGGRAGAESPAAGTAAATANTTAADTDSAATTAARNGQAAPADSSEGTNDGTKRPRRNRRSRRRGGRAEVASGTVAPSAAVASDAADGESGSRASESGGEADAVAKRGSRNRRRRASRAAGAPANPAATPPDSTPSTDSAARAEPGPSAPAAPGSGRSRRARARRARARARADQPATQSAQAESEQQA
ncbi:hypothetical protein JMUB6875_38720 [Nocardia sp. JMUB6875]